VTLFSKLIRHLPGLWLVSALAAGVLGAVLARLLVPVVVWKFAVAGWLLALINSLAAIAINSRAIGRSRNAFIGWGLVANTLRVLTLLIIFAFIIFFEGSGKAAFFIAVFAGFFTMLGIEVLSLFGFQSRNVN
jgi:hypothetical protein